MCFGEYFNKNLSFQDLQNIDLAIELFADNVVILYALNCIIRHHLMQSDIHTSKLKNNSDAMCNS